MLPIVLYTSGCCNCTAELGITYTCMAKFLLHGCSVCTSTATLTDRSCKSAVASCLVFYRSITGQLTTPRFDDAAAKTWFVALRPVKLCYHLRPRPL